MGARFAIAAGHALTAEAGAEVLAAGGTAMDAAYAAALMAMVAEPVLAGLLGGGFAMIRTPRGTTHLLDAFVEAPRRVRPAEELDLRAIQADFGAATQGFRIGAGSIAVPGLAAGLAEAQVRFGRMDPRELAAPAIRAAREGVVLTPFQATLAEIVAPILTASPGACALHCEDGRPKRPGARLANPDLGEVLGEYAAEGPRFVQEGEIAARLLGLCAAGGQLARADLAAWRPVWRAPLVERRGAAEFALNPPPALGGALVGLALALIPPGTDAVGLAQVFAAVNRARAGLDPADPEAAERLAGPGLRAALAEALAPGRGRATRGTTQISAIDAEGMGVALTLSNGEGCGLVLPGTGIMPNNMLGESDLLPGGPTAFTPGIRLASMMAPMAVVWPDGRLAMLGSGGSSRIRTALVQVALRLVDGGERLAAAIEAPRLHAEGADPAAIDAETEGRPEGETAALRAAFPGLRLWPRRSMFFGGVHAALRDARGGLAAAGDPRRDGAARAG